MKGFEECKKIADIKASIYSTKIVKAYSIADDFVFYAEGEWEGVFPIVVLSEDGSTCGLWKYLNDKDKTMDDMTEITLTK